MGLLLASIVVSGWLLAWAPGLALGVALMALLRRRKELGNYAKNHKELAVAKDRGSHKARLQHPGVDLSACIGCGTCIDACPEDGVLAILHGQAVVVHGARCVGHGLCAAACPVGGIALTLGDISDRRDLPALSDDLEVVGVPGLFLAGEIGGFALVRTAVAQGVTAADSIARRLGKVGAAHRPARASKRAPARTLAMAGVGAPAGTSCDLAEKIDPDDPMDLLIVGAGPGGIACSLRCKELGLDYVTIEQEEWIGGTVASYPRRKMVMTQPVHLPLHGRLSRLSYLKEELIELWEQLAAEQELPIRLGVRLTGLTRGEDGVFVVETSQGIIRARHVCLALGRRGSPRKLGVPGEDLPKVAYSLLDTASYRNRRVMVAGGGDSAIEAAVGLAEQPGNEVTLSYRKKAFFRLKAKNEARIQKAIDEGRVRALFETNVARIDQDSVTLESSADDAAPEQEVPNDDLFIFAGGTPPFKLLEAAGVSFDPKDHPKPAALRERASALLTALSLSLLCAIVLVGWATWHRAYYGLEADLRPFSPLYPWLRPAGTVGLSFGLLACGLFVWNLAYLLRRAPRLARWLPGSLRFWMGTHVFTGLVAFLCVLAHAGFSIKDTIGGHAFMALAVVVVTGCIGRYLYAFVPRAANGTEVDLEGLQAQLTSLSAEWDRDGRGFGMRVQQQIDGLISAGRWRPGFLSRAWAMVRGQFRLRRALAQLQNEGRLQGVPDDEVRRIQVLAKRAYRLTLLVTHYEEVRAVLSSWRYFHRWLAVLMLLLAAIHIVTAMRFAQVDWQQLPLVGGGG